MSPQPSTPSAEAFAVQLSAPSPPPNSHPPTPTPESIPNFQEPVRVNPGPEENTDNEAKLAKMGVNVDGHHYSKKRFIKIKAKPSADQPGN